MANKLKSLVSIAATSFMLLVIFAVLVAVPLALLYCSWSTHWAVGAIATLFITLFLMPDNLSGPFDDASPW